MRPEERQDGLRDMHRSEQIDRVHVVDISVCGLLGAAHGRHAGVVEEHVDVAKDGPGGFDLGRDVLAAGGDVELEQGEVGGFERGQTFFDFAAGCDDFVAAGDDFLDEGFADARGGAGDEPDEGGHFGGGVGKGRNNEVEVVIEKL